MDEHKTPFEVADVSESAEKVGTTPETLKEMREHSGALDIWAFASDKARTFINDWTGMKMKDRIDVFGYITEVSKRIEPEKIKGWGA